MRKLATAIAIGLLAGATFFAAPTRPVKAAAISHAKVVLIVGATHGSTSGYRADMDALASAFEQYTDNVIKIYSPNATWSEVRSKATGANILVYMGHGNGEPSPYHPNMLPGTRDVETVDGLGLNLTAGNGDSNVHYYGEKYVMTLDLAPHALVMLNHLCYASGNSEPGDPEPTLAVAKQRVDNMAAGWIHAGADAVIAMGHNDLSGYVRSVFTDSESIRSMFETYEWGGSNFTSWASSRNSTYTSEMDPTGGYYRSIVFNPSLKTSDVPAGAAATFVSKTGTYVPMSPARVIDTRPGGVGPYGWIMGGGVYTYQITGKKGIPSNAVAITGNLTVTGASRGGYLTLAPAIWTKPTTSTINFHAGQDRANGITVPLSPTGQLQAWYGPANGYTVHMILDVTGYFLPDSSGKGYVPFGPKRILDTRPGAENVSLTGKFGAQIPRKIQVAGQQGLPDASEIKAIVGNVTVANATGKGFVYLSPNALTPNVMPSSSTINFVAGDVVANNFVVPINADGTISAMFWSTTAGASTDLVIDISGYFATSGGAQYHTLNPARIMDSRTNIGVHGPFTPGSVKTLQVTGHGGVPNDAIAITANLTDTLASAAGYGAIGPTVSAGSIFSNINFPARDDRANGVTVPLNAGGTVQIVFGASSGNVHFVLDVCGYYQ